MLSDASTVELHHAERSSPQSAAAHTPLAAKTPDPDPNTPHAAASPAALTPAADDGPPAPVLCDSPAGVPSGRGLPALSFAGSAVLDTGVGLGQGLGHAAAHPEDEVAQTASAPRTLTGHAKPCQSGQVLPERAWASGSPDSDEELQPMATPPATALQAGTHAEPQDAAGAAESEQEVALAADRSFADFPAGLEAGVMPGQHEAVEGVLVHSPSQTAPSCIAAEAGTTEHAPLAAAHGEAGTSLLSDAGAAEPEAASGARAAAGDAPGATPASAAAAAEKRGDVKAPVSKAMSAPGSNPLTTLDSITPSLPEEDALVGGEPVTPPGLLAAMAACGASVGCTAAPAAGEGLREGSDEAELPPLDSAGRREVPSQLLS